MPDKLDKCYYWHIITLTKMKYKLGKLGKIIQNKKEKNFYTDQDT